MILTLQVQDWRSLMLRNFTMLRIMMMEQRCVLLPISTTYSRNVFASAAPLITVISLAHICIGSSYNRPSLWIKTKPRSVCAIKSLWIYQYRWEEGKNRFSMTSFVDTTSSWWLALPADESASWAHVQRDSRNSRLIYSKPPLIRLFLLIRNAFPTHNLGWLIAVKFFGRKKSLKHRHVLSFSTLLCRAFNDALWANETQSLCERTS